MAPLPGATDITFRLSSLAAFSRCPLDARPSCRFRVMIPPSALSGRYHGKPDNNKPEGSCEWDIASKTIIT
jgi:hypothetical protein